MRVILTILFTFLTSFVFGQDNIRTERTNRSGISQVVEKGSWQVESGFHYEGESKGYYSQYYFQAPKVQQRYGLIKNVELRLAISGANIFARNHGAFSSNYYISGFEAPVIGTKIQLLQQKKFIPHIAVLTEATLNPFASKTFKSKRIKPNLQFLMSNKINDKLLVGCNLGSYWDDYFHYSYGIYLQKQWGQKLLTNIEYAGHTSSPNEMRANKRSELYGSLGYFISNQVIGDIGLGRGVGNTPDFFFRAGMSFVLTKKSTNSLNLSL